MNADTTVRELAALVRRTKTALAEDGETQLSEWCQIAVLGDEVVKIVFYPPTTDKSRGHERVEKALSFDPVFEIGQG